jgi:uncharacterized delta-60 repeat protein
MSQRRTSIRNRAFTGVALAVVSLALTPAAASAAAGDLDTSFGTGGKRVLPGTEQPLDVYVQPDGKIITVGGQNSIFSSFKGFLVRRVNPDGSMDRSFDGDGTAVATFPTVGVGDQVTALGSALQPDGAIVVAGNAGSAGIAVARFAPSGALDKTFGEGGADGDGRTLITNVFTGFGVSDVVLLPSGRIALAGTQGNDSDIGVLRLRSDGSPDGTAFDPGDFADGSEFATVATQSGDGTTTVVGTTSTTTGTVGAVVRYRSDGKLDTSLAGTGRTTVTSIEAPTAAVFQPDGKLLVAGTSGQPQRKALVTRLTREGSVDPAFGNGGPVEVGDADRDNVASSIVLQPDGKILVAGTSGGTAENATFDGFVARLDAAGRPDAGYGAGGRATVSFGEIGLGGPAALQPDGKVVFAGYGVTTGLVPRPAVARLLADPAPDQGPSGGGGGQPATPEPDTQLQQQGPDVVTNGPGDTLAPRLSALRAVPARGGRRLDVRFTLSEAARVRFTLQRLPRKGRPRAVRGSFSIAANAGTTRIDVGRRSIVRRLAAGRYRLVATATDSAGNRGAAARAAFTRPAAR